MAVVPDEPDHGMEFDWERLSRSELQRPWLVFPGLALGICVSNEYAQFSYWLVLPAMQADLG